jgi:hypothetical protein
LRQPGQRLQPKAPDISDVARLNRPEFNRLIMEKTFGGLGFRVAELFELLNGQFFDASLPLPIILPAQHGGLGTCYKDPFMVITMRDDLYLFGGINAHCTMLHESVHLANGLKGIDEGDHDGDGWLDECQRILDMLNVRVDLRTRPAEELRGWPQSTFMRFKGVWMYFERSIRERGKLIPLPGGWTMEELPEEQGCRLHVLQLCGDPAEDTEVMLCEMGKSYCGQLAEGLNKILN